MPIGAFHVAVTSARRSRMMPLYQVAEVFAKGPPLKSNSISPPSVAPVQLPSSSASFTPNRE